MRAKLKPSLTGWIAHRRPFAFETGAIEPREDSYRYLNGTPHIPALFACRPGLEILNEIGISAKSRGWKINTPENPAERAGTVSIECPHAYEVCRELLAREILVDYRPRAGVRLSPHFYNREDECDFALTQMEEILKAGAWEKHAAAVTHA